MTLHQTNTDWPVYEELGRRKGTIIAEAKAADDGFFEKIEYPEGFNGNPTSTPGATGCDPILICHQLKKFKIVSTDGLSDNTKIYYGDEQLKGVTNIQLTLDAEVGVTFLTMTVLAPEFDITLNPELVNLRTETRTATRLNVEDIITRIRNELSPVPEENIDKDSTA